MEEEILNPEEEVVIPKRGFAVCRNVQSYKDLNATINAAKGYPNHSNGTDRYSEEEPYLYVDGLPAMLIESNTTEIVGEEVVEENVQLEKQWVAGEELKIDDKRVYLNKLYKVNQDHTSAEQWKPNLTEALYSEVDFDDEISEWRPVTGAHNTYGMGAQCYYNGHLWESTHPANSWPPGTAGLWLDLGPTGEEPPEDLCVSTAAWDISQATYYQTEVMAGRVVHVKYNNRIWKSKNATHLYIAPALSGNGAISWEFVKLCE